MAQLPVMAIAGIVSAVAAVGSTAYAISKGSPKVPSAPPPINLSDAQAAQNQSDALLARRGSAADILNGDSGTTPTLPGPKQLLGA